MGFQKATRRQGKLRLGLCGPSGSGKTYTALRIATGLCAPGKRIALTDTERGSASLYAGKFDFDVDELADFRVQTYLKSLRAAEAAGYDVVILDSISHAWAGKGGLLEQVDNSREKNKFAAWRDVTPQHHEFVEALLSSPCHIIATMRSKTEWVLEENEKGAKVPRKVGLAPVQRDGMEYEFTIVGDLDGAKLTVSKTRVEDVVPLKAVIQQPGEALGKALGEWLAGGSPAPVVTVSSAKPALETAAFYDLRCWAATNKVPGAKVAEALQRVIPAGEKPDRAKITDGQAAKARAILEDELMLGVAAGTPPVASKIVSALPGTDDFEAPEEDAPF